MKKLKSLFIGVLAVAMTAPLSGCDREIILNVLTDVPSEISTYVATHFPGNKILQAVKDKDGLIKTYDIVLAGNISLEFNRKKEIIDIDSDSKLPDSVIPEKLRAYVNSNFPDNFITDWELEDRNQQVGLNNGLDLEFTMNGDFIRIDD